MTVPLDCWEPLAPDAVGERLRGAPFVWCLAGGLALERYVGRAHREHGDTDIVVFRPDLPALQAWLDDWELLAADPPGTLRPWAAGEVLGAHVHDLWGHRRGRAAWELQVMVAERDGSAWFDRRDRRVTGPVKEVVVVCGGLPCLAPEIQLLHKARSPRSIDEQDFAFCLPALDGARRRRLAELLALAFPGGHPWLERLAE